MTAIPRGLRNCNPGNIRHSNTPWKGEVPGNDPAFITFGTMVDGVRAMAKLLQNYQKLHGINTVTGIINRWAPPNENDTVGYIAYVASSIGVPPDAPLTLTNSDTLARLVYAIICRENGQAVAAQYVTAFDLHAGVCAACGVAL